MKCDYCKEFRRGFLEIEKENFGNRILFETENFLVFPTLGQIVEGYLLIASKEHYLNIGEIPLELYPELEKLQHKVRKVLEDNYYTPLFFEHGPASASLRSGCCIEHAHIHAVPLQLDILESISKNFKGREITNYTEIKRHFQRGIQYLFYEDNKCKRYLFTVHDIIPPQYLRKVIAHKIGHPEKWDWKNYLGLAELSDTIRKLKGKFGEVK